jgi:hypothetical protein
VIGNVVFGSAVGGNHIMKDEKKNKWVRTDDEKPDDSIKNRPDWSERKERVEIRIEPKPPTPLEDWVNNK